MPSPARGSSTSPAAAWSTSARWSARFATGRSGGAVLDAFREEPLPPDSPLYDLPNLIVTPAHVVVQRPRARPEHRAVLRQPAPVRRRRAAAQPRRPERRVLTRDDRPMQIAIVGLARSGKTTVFNTLTRGQAETGGFGGMTVNIGVVKVPDERLDPADRALQAQARESRPTSPTSTCRRRPVAEGHVATAANSRPTSWRGCAPPTRCSTWCAPSRTRPCRIPTDRSTRGATSSSWSWSSCSPTCRWSRSGSRSCAPAAGTARPPSASPTSASWWSWSSSCRR